MLDLLYRKRNHLISTVVDVCVLLKYLRLSLKRKMLEGGTVFTQSLQ